MTRSEPRGQPLLDWLKAAMKPNTALRAEHTYFNPRFPEARPSCRWSVAPSGRDGPSELLVGGRAERLGAAGLSGSE